MPVRMGVGVERVHHEGGRIVAVDVRGESGTPERVEGTDFLSSMPLRELVLALDPAVPEPVRQAADRLRYRDHITVGLVLDRSEPFPDNWIYIHSPDVRVGRVQNFKAWSPEMVPDASRSCLGLEYFVQEGDDLWTMPDPELLALGRKECAALGLIREEDVVDGTVIRMPKAYPIYDGDYQEALTTVREYLAGFGNLQPIGRNGQHRYNNQDHSMVTGVYAARNVLGDDYAVWEVNVEEEYHEEVRSGASGDRMVPERIAAPRLGEVLGRAFARYDPVALGVAVGTVASVGLFLAAAVLLIRGGDVIGPKLSLLGQFLPGFGMTWPQAALGAAEAGALGFLFGALLASLLNGVVALHARGLRRRLELAQAARAVGGEV